jgi:uncharacterized repeat protein (TIGR03803 family)
MNKPSAWKSIPLLCVFCIAGAISSPARTLTTLASFDKTNGAAPYFMSLVQGTDGNFYGTTYGGGAHNYGTVFKITPAGTLTTLYSFCSKSGCADGEYPYAGLVLATNGNFYGTTSYGGAHGEGTVFEINTMGELTTLYSFCAETACVDGEEALAGLVQASNGRFYGTTYTGGAYGGGTVFEITAAGKLTTLHSFESPEGYYPNAGLVQATNGNFYGTTVFGGAHDYGSVFEVAPGGKMTTLHSFDSTDGSHPYAGLVQAANGDFYGTTYEGGAHDYGTVFEITTGGAFTTLGSFDDTDGAYPYAGLIQATNGNFYGTTYLGGAHSDGTVFEISGGGTLTTLASFDGTDGCCTYAGLLQATNGSFYGTTPSDGAHAYGTVFSLADGLGPFVETNPTSGAVGTAVTILGNNLTGSTSVTFNGTAATFKVVSSTEITTTLPKGATTGPVKVKTPSATLTSNVSFRVP